MAITMINPRSFEPGVLRKPLLGQIENDRILCCDVAWPKLAICRIAKVASFDFAETDDLILEIKGDYDLLRQKLIDDGFEALTGRDGKWIQARTKGAGHGSTSRAFHARTRLVKKIFELAKTSDLLLTDKLAA